MPKDHKPYRRSGWNSEEIGNVKGKEYLRQNQVVKYSNGDEQSLQQRQRCAPAQGNYQPAPIHVYRQIAQPVQLQQHMEQQARAAPGIY